MSKPIPNVSSLAIHLISSHAEIEKVKAIESPVKFIELLVRTYNQKKEEKKDHTFLPIKNLSWHRSGLENFHLIPYYSRRAHTCSSGLFVEHFSSGENQGAFESITFHFAFFVYFSVKQKETDKKIQQQWAIFALTSNQAFRLIRPFCDYGFPTRIAFRIVVPELIKKEVTPLVGSKEASSNHYKKGYQLRLHEYENLWVIYKNFDAELKAGCSLLPFLQVKEDRRVGVHIGEGMIRLSGSYPFECYVAMLPTLLSIRKGMVTHTTKKEQEIDDPAFQSFANIQRINPKQEKILDAGLISLLHRLITKGGNTALHLSHTYYHQYYTSSTFTLKVHWKGGNYQTTWHYPPSLDQLIEVLSTFFHGCSLEEFAKGVHETSMQCDGIGPTFHPLIDYIQGELFYDGDIYFKVGGVWLKVLNQHLATTERSFIELLKAILATKENKKGHLLDNQWISKEEWVAFSPKDYPSPPSEETKKALEEATFSFIDAKGKVVVPYPTRALFTDQKTSIIKSLKKKWAELEDWLKENEGKVVTAKDLQAIFSKKKDTGKVKDLSPEVFKLLQTPYHVLRSLQKNVGSVAPVGKSEEVNVSDLTQFKKLKGTPNYISDNFDLLSQLLANNSSVKEGDLTFIQPDSKKRKKTYEWLTTKHSLEAEFSDRCVAQGPIPKTIEMASELRAFLEEKHRDYQLVMDEEHYSRLFLNRTGYLVCDQVFPGERNHVELFDLLYFGEDGKLYLYAIKEGFGTSTGIACTQIRVAAESIEAARRSGSEIISELYDAAVGTKATTDFRKKLIKDLLKVGKKAFVNFFKEREIIFVYAFLDTGTEDHRLKDELNLQTTITSSMLKESATDPLLTLDFLVAMGFLDENYRLLDAFLQTPSGKFKAKCEAFIQEVFNALQSKRDIDQVLLTLQLTSTRNMALQNLLKKKKIASNREGLTLPALQNELMAFDPKKVAKTLWGQVSQFDSMIAKIELIKLRKEITAKGFQLQIIQLDRPGKTAARPPLNVLDDTSLAPSVFHTATIPYDGDLYSYGTTPYSLEEIFMTFLGEDSPFLCRKLLSTLFNQKLDTLKESDLAQLASRFDHALVIVHVDHPQQAPKAEPDVPMILLIKDSHDQYYISKEAGLPPLETSRERSTLFQDLKSSTFNSLGIVNNGNDCFLNATMQFLIHSPIIYSLIERRKEAHPFALQFANFVLEYAEGDAQKMTTKAMRHSLVFSPYSQEDAAEALGKMLEAFDIAELAPSFTIERKINTDAAFECEATEPTPLKELEKVEGDVRSIIHLPIPEGDSPSLADCWNLYEEEREIGDSIVYLENDKSYKVERYMEAISLESEPEFLLLQIKRFTWNEALKKREKIEKLIGVTEEMTIHEIPYRVVGFINHEGASPKVGHYTATVLVNGTWTHFNDENVTLKDDFAAVQEEANTSYILMLHKVKEKREDS
ncbi:MAG: hypothetical protein H7A38_06430 [Chlamydiales bacterium]|nr:hypothetical protein [Chlamydiales bacterium]